MLYSKTTEYAIRALACLASKKEERAGGYHFTKIPAISQETGVPGPYIAKIFQCLVRKKLLVSRRGVEGGFALNRDPKTISVMEVIEAIEDASPFHHCVMGFEECSADNACPLHHIWKAAKERISDKLRVTSIIEMAKKNKPNQYRGIKRSQLHLIFNGSGI